MKKNKLLLPLTAIVFSLPLASCAKTCESYRYALNTGRKGAEGITIGNAQIKVHAGKVESLSYEEIYSPTIWARVDESQKDSIDTISIQHTKSDSTTETLYYAKYIETCGLKWIASERTSSDTYYEYNEYVTYSAVGSTSAQSTSDLIRYLATEDSTTYKLGETVKLYYEEVTGNKVKFLKNTGSEENLNLQEQSAVTPKTSNVLRSANDAEWKKSIDALCTYFVGKAINYSATITVDGSALSVLKNDGGTWSYSYESTISTPETASEFNANFEKIEGCLVSQINKDEMAVILNDFDIAFASVEYDSLA